MGGGGGDGVKREKQREIKGQIGRRKIQKEKKEIATH